jgi:hypothetical protein
MRRSFMGSSLMRDVAWCVKPFATKLDILARVDSRHKGASGVLTRRHTARGLDAVRKREPWCGEPCVGETSCRRLQGEVETAAPTRFCLNPESTAV